MLKFYENPENQDDKKDNNNDDDFDFKKGVEELREKKRKEKTAIRKSNIFSFDYNGNFFNILFYKKSI